MVAMRAVGVVGLLLGMLEQRLAGAGGWLEARKVLALDASWEDYAGYSVALDGDVAMVGAYKDDNSRGVDAGCVYVFVRNVGISPSTWSATQKLVASDGAGDNRFGYSVALDGDVAMVGAPWGLEGHAVYVFVRDAGSGLWSEVQKLVASDRSVTLYTKFGESVAFDGEVVVVGAPWTGILGINVTTNATEYTQLFKGSVYVFVRDVGSGTWSEAQKLVASDGAGRDYFGNSVALDGDVAMVGAYKDDNSRGVDAGAMYVFVRDVGNGTWSEAQKLVASDGAGRDYFSYSVALDGDVAMVGAYKDDNSRGVDAGAMYVFVRDVGNGTWSEAQKLVASDGAGGDYFGYSVALDGDVAMVGAPWDNNAGRYVSDVAVYDVGAVYVYARDVGSSAWSEVQKLLPSDGWARDHFGFSVALDGNTAIAGAPAEDIESGGWYFTNAGSAFIFGSCHDIALVESVNGYSRGMCCHNFASVSSVDTGSCVSCTGPEAADCMEASCAAGFAHYNRGMCCHNFASVSSVDTGSCVSCTGPEAADCMEASCAAGFAYYNRGMCCHDFASVSSVETGSCVSCTGPEAADCMEASCAAGFTRYSRGGECVACHDFASVSSVETGSCVSCTGPEAADCMEASCAAGFTRYSRGGECVACHDFASVSSVETGSCVSCTGPEAADCMEATCVFMHIHYDSGSCWPVLWLAVPLLGAVLTLVLLAIRIRREGTPPLPVVLGISASSGSNEVTTVVGTVASDNANDVATVVEAVAVTNNPVIELDSSDDEIIVVQGALSTN